MYLADQDCSPEQTIDEKLCDGAILIGYGKAGHGMNGRDADLDRVGQCVVESLVTLDPIREATMKIAINLKLYASLSYPSYEDLDGYRERMSDEEKELYSKFVDVSDDDVFLEYLKDQASLVFEGMHWDTFDDCDGDEDGFYGNKRTTLFVDLFVDEYEEIEDGNQETLDRIAHRINKEICDANKGHKKGRNEVKLFEDEVGLANDMINDICK